MKIFDKPPQPPKVDPIISDIQSFRPPTPMPTPAQGEVHQAEIAGEYVMTAIILNQYYIRLMDAARSIRNALPLRMQDTETGKYPALDDLYCTLGLMRIDIARLNGEPVTNGR